MTLLAIETSCDETSASVIRDGLILSNIVSSQIKLHAEYGGVVPELATREHLRNLPLVVDRALASAKVSAEQLQAVAATQGPGLPNALMIGFKFAQGTAYRLNKPFYGIQHHEAHLYSPWIEGGPARAKFDAFQPNISLIVSGGHTLLVDVRDELNHKVLGSTLDDAAGECFDKTGKLIGLPYPAGPQMDNLAREGNRDAFHFPRPMLNDPGDDFSFSGLKTAVRYFLQKHPGVAGSLQGMKDICASVQAAIVDVLVTKTIRAARRAQRGCVTASGGVVANRHLREELAKGCAANGLVLRLAQNAFCTDNAAMIGILAERKIRANIAPTALDAEILPNYPL